MQYIILGTGPVGVIVAEYLLKQNRKVVILDNSQTPNNNSKDYTLKKVIEIPSQRIFIAKTKILNIFLLLQQRKEDFLKYGVEHLANSGIKILKCGIYKEKIYSNTLNI